MASINAMKNKLQGKMASTGVPHSQWFALSVILQNPDMGIKEISGMLCISPSAATQLVDGLAQSGYVARKTNAADRRSLHLEISPKGLQKIAAIKKEYAKAMEKLFGALSDRELATYLKLHKKILSNYSN